MMTFQEQLIATIIGSFTGFLFAVVLFILSEKLKNYLAKKQLGRNLILECQYNIEILKEVIERFKSDWENDLKYWENSDEFPEIEIGRFRWFMDCAISVKIHFLSTFFEKALESGFIFEVVDIEDVNNYISVSYILKNWSSTLSEEKVLFLNPDNTGDMGKCLLGLYKGKLPRLELYGDLAAKLIKNIKNKYKINL